MGKPFSFARFTALLHCLGVHYYQSLVFVAGAGCAVASLLGRSRHIRPSIVPFRSNPRLFPRDGCPKLPAACLQVTHYMHFIDQTTFCHDHNADTMPSRRQKYSIYLPLHRPSRATSRATSATKEGARSPKPGDRKSSRASAAAAAAAHAQSMAKRRSTMNSRDAAYDEEQLRRAIEISQKEVIPEEGDGTQLRRPKRIRDDDDE
jgi:hypothetical protein